MRTPTKLATDEEILANRACLKRLARHLVSADAAADLEQDTWAAAFAHRPEADRPVRIWVMEVMRNFARMSRRRATVVAAHRDDVIEAATPEVPAAADQLLERLGRAARWWTSWRNCPNRTGRRCCFVTTRTGPPRTSPACRAYPQVPCAGG